MGSVKRPLKQLLGHQRTLKHASKSQTNEGRLVHGFCSSIRQSDTGFIKTSHAVNSSKDKQNANCYLEDTFFEVVMYSICESWHCHWTKCSE